MDDLEIQIKQKKDRDITMLMYLLLALGFVTGGLTCIAAIIINYVKKDDIEEPWLLSHFFWQRNTFWYGLLWTILAFFSWIFLLGWFFGGMVTIWLIYRIVKGAIYLNDGKTLFF